jgi:SAM-dependent methyltransferase
MSSSTVDVYLQEYSSEDAIRKYTSETAGHGISYLLAHDYADIYLNAVNRFLKTDRRKPLRLLEFGCGAGMNVISLFKLLETKGKTVELAIGADFSERLITAANSEARSFLSAEQREKMRFAVARNEQLASDLASALKTSEKKLANSFQLILGVNTFRYCHRLGKEMNCAQAIAGLLAPGGICIMIDMNRRFPAFRSRFRRTTETKEEKYLPTLEQYASPFRKAGLELLRKENFCWIPHSASPALTNICRVSTPLLNLVAKPFAMRSLVVSRKAN